MQSCMGCHTSGMARGTVATGDCIRRYTTTLVVPSGCPMQDASRRCLSDGHDVYHFVFHWYMETSFSECIFVLCFTSLYFSIVQSYSNVHYPPSPTRGSQNITAFIITLCCNMCSMKLLIFTRTDLPPLGSSLAVKDTQTPLQSI